MRRLEENMYRVLLYYKYVTIENPQEFAAQHLHFCKELGLKGRILIAEEGINGTISGTVEQTNRYMNAMKEDVRFASMVFKIDDAAEHAFKKLHVRARKELVTLRLEEDVDPNELTGTYAGPKEFLKAMKEENTIILDARNDYEHELGHFKGAIRPSIDSFRELPAWIQENKEQLEGKKILTYCTGGIRCEKFSGWLRKEGFENVLQLHGGIVTYGKDPEVRGENWDGQCYVFDERISVPINHVNPTIIGKDFFTGEPCERYVNCANPECDRRMLCSEENEHKYMRSCSSECREHPRNKYVREHGLTQEQIKEKTQTLLLLP